MFKGTNKIWKVVALALVLCMLPIAAFAASSTSTVTITTTAEEAKTAFDAGNPLTIAGTTSSQTVTILVVRSDAAVEAANLGTAEVLEKVIYAAQMDSVDNAFSFTFVPTADVDGSQITVFVGGTGASDLATLSFAVATTPSAPSSSTVTFTTTAAEAKAAFDAGNPLTIAGTTSSQTVTILVVRSDAEVDAANLGSADVLAKVIYAAQMASTSGAFSFTFVPLAAVEGSQITVFVGGTGASDLATLSFAVETAPAAPTAPTVTADWKEGEALVLALSGVTGEEANTWYGKVNSFTINGNEVAPENRVIDALGTKITIADTTGITTPATIVITTTDNEYAAVELTNVAPVVAHVAPSITDVAITPAAVEGKVVAGTALTASTVGFVDNKGYADKSTFTWTVAGKEPVSGATFTPAVADIGKTLTVTATPTVIEEAPLTGEPKSMTVEIVLPEYNPTVDVTITGGKVTVGTEAEATVTYDLTYEADTVYAVEYTWYVVPAELVKTAPDKIAAAIEKVKDSAEGVEAIEGSTYAKTYANDYAVVKAVATYTIAGVELATKPEDYAAVLIKGKSTGGSIGGAVLPGAEKPEADKPGTDKPEDEVSGDPIANGAAAFTDVDKTTYAWAYDSIDALAKAGIFKGMTPTTFGPELTATNAQVVALAVRIAGLKADGAKTDLVAEDHWVYAEMAIADAKDILGVFGDKIAVEDATTREVAFTLLYNALKAAGIELPETAEAIEYTDASSIDAGCVEAITALTKAGIVNGMGDGTVAPKATITRAQLAKILGLAKALVK